MDSLQAPSVPRPRWYGWLALLAIGPLLLLSFKLFPSLDQPALHSPLVHVLVAGGAAVLGVMLALLVLHVARQARDGRVYLVGMGFLSIASIFLVHAASTPDVLMTGRGLATLWSAPLSLVLGAIFFCISSLELSPKVNRLLVRYSREGLLLFLIFWIAYVQLFLLFIPMAAPPAPQTMSAAAGLGEVVGERAVTQRTEVEVGVAQAAGHVEGQQHGSVDQSAGVSTPLSVSDALRISLSIAGLLCYVFAAARHYRLYRNSPSAAGIAIVGGIVLFGEALLTQLLSQVYTASFWLYHAEEFVGFGVISYAVLIAYQRGQSQASLLEGLFLATTRARMQSAYAHVMDSLVEMLSRGEEPSLAQLQDLQGRFGMTATQVGVLERAALAVAHERRQRQELERLNAALRQLEQDKEQLIQMVVHDLKNPLTALIGFLEILRMDRLSSEQMMLLDGALRSGKNLSGLISDLLDVGRIEEGRLELDRSLFAPRELLTDCVAEMSAWLAQDGKTIRIEASADLPPLQADLRLIRRVLLNLLSNAIKHTPPGTYIILRALLFFSSEEQQTQSRGSAGLLIEVEDTGPGIPPQHLDRIFEKFGRVNGEPYARQDSTGLGLTFCRLAMEAHGGTIGVSSVVGRGTTFRITLPIT